MNRSFDMDLLNVLPAAREILEPIADIRVMTNGEMRDGKLLSVSTWNGPETMLAFFALAPKVVTPQHRVAPRSYWTDSPCIALTVEEMFRDCWIHTYGIHFRCEDTWVKVWDSFPLQQDFMTLMYHIRGLRKCDEAAIAAIKKRVLDSIQAAVPRFIGVTGVSVNAELTGRTNGENNTATA